MQFNSYLFVCFFALVLLVHRSGLGWTVKKVALLLFSYAFYAAWDPPYVVLLWASTVVDWHVAQGIARSTVRSTRKRLLMVSIVFNLGMLAYFKYGALFTNGALDAGPLPIGISFYTFMTISYTVDVYFDRAKPARSFLDYALYVTFFPHLVSGPIVRATELVPQFEAPRSASREQIGWGAALITLGLFEKVFVADGVLAPIVDKVYALDRAAVSTLDAWTGTVAFAGQIFCDFAGYSTVAIGVAMCLGFALPDNFRFPYAATGFSDFWRRWHISLSSWLRDYLYIPLGGNKRGEVRTYANLLVTMLLGGLWHGASWTFVVWGGLHGLYLVVERLLRKRLHGLAGGHLARIAGILVTFALVCFAWVFFRAATFEQAFRVVRAMFGAGHGASIAALPSAFIPVGALLVFHYLLRDASLEDVVARTTLGTRVVVLTLMILAIVLCPGADRAFIYFQF